MQKVNDALLAREQFAVSLRQKKKKEIIMERRRRLHNHGKTILEQEESD